MLRVAGCSSLVSCVLLSMFIASSPQSFGDDRAIVSDVDRQPLVAATQRLIEALEFSGTPPAPDVVDQLQDAFQNPDDKAAVRRIQEVLDPLCEGRPDMLKFEERQNSR